MFNTLNIYFIPFNFQIIKSGMPHFVAFSWSPLPPSHFTILLYIIRFNKKAILKNFNKLNKILIF